MACCSVVLGLLTVVVIVTSFELYWSCATFSFVGVDGHNFSIIELNLVFRSRIWDAIISNLLIKFGGNSVAMVVLINVVNSFLSS
jgi:hypothetical protein